MPNHEMTLGRHRVLVIDDNPAIHQDFRKILVPDRSVADLAEAEAELFGTSDAVSSVAEFDVESAYQGQEGLARVDQAAAEGRPYALAFVDVRMPPGWDGVETIQRIWERHPDLQVVICTAYSDYSWEAMVKRLGQSESLLILKKPFDSVEVMQLAHALARKYIVTRQAQLRMADLDRLVTERTAELSAANAQLLREVEQRTQAQEALRRSEERFAKAFEATPIPLAILCRGGDVVDHVNEGFLVLAGREREAVARRSFRDLGLWRESARWADRVLRLNQGQRIRHEPAETLRPDGSIRQVLLSLESIPIGGEPCILLIAQDVTEQKLLEKQLLQSQKMESIGQLAAGVAHDFNNLLTIIEGHTTLQLANDRLDEEVLESLRQVHLAAVRASGLTRQLLAFSRKQVSQPHRLDVGALSRRLETMLRRLLGELIDFQGDYAPDLPSVVGDETGIEQVIMNLVVNARDAMPQGGRLSLKVEAVELLSTDIPLHPEGRPGRFVCLAVSDTGGGIPSDVLPRIYEPFFTTKDVGKGTGLGLSTVYAVMKQHAGWIEVTSAVGVGTTFRVFLPVWAPTAPAPETSQTTLFVKRHSETRGHETVLLVDDEGALRHMAARALSRQGYLVVEAGNGPEALQKWEQCGGAVDLLFTDVVLPQGLSGIEVARRLKEQRPELKTLLSSGYSVELEQGDVHLVEGVNFLPKPYDAQTLIETVRRCLDAVEVAPGTAVPSAYEEAAPRR